MFISYLGKIFLIVQRLPGYQPMSSKVIGYWKSHLLKDHCCLFSFPFCFHESFGVLSLSSYFIHGGNIGEKINSIFPCLSLFIGIFFLFVCGWMFVRWFLVPNHILLCYSLMPFSYLPGSVWLSRNMSLKRWEWEEQKLCWRALVPKPGWLCESHEVL